MRHVFVLTHNFCGLLDIRSLLSSFEYSFAALSVLRYLQGVVDPSCLGAVSTVTMAGDDLGGEEDERAIELSALAAIYPELDLQSSEIDTDVKRATLRIAVEPLRPVYIRTPVAAEKPSGLDNGEILDKEEAGVDSHELQNLPPLVVSIGLPRGYPPDEPPLVTISTQDSWLDKGRISELERDATRTWQSLGHEQMIYAFIDHLQEEAETCFGISDPMEFPRETIVSLLDFDLKARRSKFENGTFDCGICLGDSICESIVHVTDVISEPKKGTACHRLQLCSHVFCLDCLQDFYSSCINEGDVGAVKCLAPDCSGDPCAQDEKTLRTPTDQTLEPSELLQIQLPQEAVQRYITLKRKKALESDRNTIYCPRQWCQGPARHKLTDPNYISQANSEDPPPLPKPSERLAICIDCTFAFCLVCKASWHGEYFACFPRSQFEVSAEEKASEDYILLHTQACPTCDARAQKTHGCNHMICFKCDTHFCYLCGSYLEKGNPYEHFNNRKNSCYMRLWELERGDDGEIGHAFAGGRDGEVVLSDDEDGDSDDDDDEAAHVLFLPDQLPARAPAAPPDGHRRMLNRAGRGGPGGPGAPRALRRFLELVEQDNEDEWDSDEMSSDEDEG